MTTADALLWLVLTPPLTLFVRRLFRFLDESAQYQLELRELQRLGLRQIGGRPVGWWIRWLYVSPPTVAQYRQLRR